MVSVLAAASFLSRHWIAAASALSDPPYVPSKKTLWYGF
jgi:hypothetical protein